MRLLSLWATGLLLPFSCHPASLQQLVQLLVAPAAGTDAPGDWARVDQLPEMKWQRTTPTQTPNGLARSGSVNIEGLGQVTIHFSGSKVGADRASLRLPQGVDKHEFSTTLLRLIPMADIKFQGHCRTSEERTQSSVYRVDLQTQTAYALFTSSRRGASLDTDLIVAVRIDSDWRCAP